MKTNRVCRGVAAALAAGFLASGCATQEAWIEQEGQSFRILRGPKEPDEIEAAWRDLEAAEKRYGPDHPEVALHLERLAELHKERGDIAEAERLYKEALGLAERLYWPEHPEVGKACNNLAVVYDLEGRSAEAEKLFKRALGVLGRSMGLRDPDTLVVLDNLGDFYTREGRYKEAETVLKRSLELKRSALGATHPDTVAAEARLNDLRGISGRATRRPAPPAETPADLEGPVTW